MVVRDRESEWERERGSLAKRKRQEVIRQRMRRSRKCWESEREPDKHTDRWAQIEKERETDRQTERDRERQTDKTNDSRHLS